MSNDPEEKSVDEISLHISDQITAMLAYWDKDQVCRFANNAYKEWFGKEKTEMVNKITLSELLGPLYEKNLPFINGALNGEIQVFEREITLPGGEIRHTLATYTPDITDGAVKGFFVHVADVSYIKELEQQVVKSKREILRTAIEMQEREREKIGTHLRDNVNQTLVYCNMVLQIKKYNEEERQVQTDVSNHIQNAICELNELSANLLPAGTEFLGLIKGIENYAGIHGKRYNTEISLTCGNELIESLDIKHRLSVFRIVQNYLQFLSSNKTSTKIEIRIDYQDGHLQILFRQNDPGFRFNRSSDKFKDIELRIEYYGGTLQELPAETETVLLINCTIS